VRAGMVAILATYTVANSLGYFFAKYALESASPLLLMGLRYAIAGAVLALAGGRIIVGRGTLILAALTASSSALWAIGLEYVSPASSAVLSYTMPFFSVPLAYVILGERSARGEILGMFLGFLGVSIYSVPLMHGFEVVGAALTLVNALFWAAYTVYYRKMRSGDPLSINTTQFVLGAAMLMALSPIGFHLDPTVGFALYLLGLAIPSGALTFLLWNLMLREESVGRATTLAFSVPLFSMALQSALELRSPSIPELIGMAVMLSGIAISRMELSRNPPTPREGFPFPLASS